MLRSKLAIFPCSFTRALSLVLPDPGVRKKSMPGVLLRTASL